MQTPMPRVHLIEKHFPNRVSHGPWLQGSRLMAPSVVAHNFINISRSCFASFVITWNLAQRSAVSVSAALVMCFVGDGLAHLLDRALWPSTYIVWQKHHVGRRPDSNHMLVAARHGHMHDECTRAARVALQPACSNQLGQSCLGEVARMLEESISTFSIDDKCSG